MENNLKCRNVGIDLLKILLALMVITIHIFANGTGHVLSNSTMFPWNMFSMFVTFLCYPAVNTYIIICGYFSYSNKKCLEHVLASLSRLWLSALFFSLFGYLFFAIFTNHFDLIEFLLRFFPIIRGVWWFYSVYFALMVLSPFVNKLIESLSCFEHRLLIVILLLLLSFLPFFVNWKDQFGSNYGYSLIWFIALYITGAYINRANVLELKYCKNFALMLLLYFLFTLFLYVFPKTISIFSFFIWGEKCQSISLAMYNSPVVYGQAIALFIGFANSVVPKFLHKFIGTISGLALSSYLLHCQEDIEKLLWFYAKPSVYANSPYLLVAIIIICITLFCSGIVLESFRKYIFTSLTIDKFFSLFVLNIYRKIEKLMK